MTLVRFAPFRSFDQTAKKMYQMMEDLEKGVKFETGGFTPYVDISEDSKAVFVQVELPGIKKDDVKVNVDEDNILVIKGEKKPVIKENATIHKTESTYGEFERRFVLPDDIDKDKIEAKYENGLLEISIMKKAKPEPKEVEIKF